MQAPPSALVGFVKVVEGDKLLQDRVRSSRNSKQILEIAKELGFGFSLTELRNWSSELSAVWFPWAGQSRQWRRDFFSR
jgi:hypothetical protein